jgi:hypothetical protein
VQFNDFESKIKRVIDNLEPKIIFSQTHLEQLIAQLRDGLDHKISNLGGSLTNLQGEVNTLNTKVLNPLKFINLREVFENGWKF